MDDEIDIEEHDVLEDPRLRNIFPDISQIKIEIPDDDFDDQPMDYEPYSDHEETSTYQGTEESAEYTRHGNKIILGSRPSPSAVTVSENVDSENPTVFGTKTVAVKQEPLHDGGDAETISRDEDEYSQSSSVIIIGSKPCKTGVIEPISVKDTVINNVSEDVNIDKPLDIVMEHNSEEDYVIKDSVVLLDNWGPVLQSSSCFCKECEILFPTTNTLHAHNNTAHSLLVVVDKNKAVKSTAKKQDVEPGKFCYHCNKMFPNSDSLISHLYKSMPVKNTQVKPTASTSKSNLQPNPFNKAFEALTPQKTVPTPRIIENIPQSQLSGSITTYSHKYKCVRCGEIFLNYTKARNHRILKHPELSGHNILKKITYSSKTPSVAIKTGRAPFVGPSKTGQISSKQPQNIPKPSPIKLSKISPSKPAEEQLTISQALVPVSVLFKCHKCDVHFTSCHPAVQHAKSCPKKPGEWTCELCQLQFKSWGRVMHNLQHKYSEKFSVYICHENIEGKVLNYCPDCNTYLHEKDFFVHTNSAQPCQKTFIKCDSCSLPIHSTSAKEHSKWHAIIKMGIKNMILVKFMKTDEVKVATGPVKRQLQMDETSAEPKKAKTVVVEKKKYKMLVFFCRTCNTFLFNGRHKDLHSNKRCKHIKKSRRVVCKLCGLICQQNHMYQKVCQRVKGNLCDMKFVTIKDNKIICPPIPQYPKCKKCHVHFCSTSSVISHDCQESHKTCKYCKEKFSDLAHKLHVRFHLLHLKYTNAASVELPKLSKPAKGNLPKIKVPKKKQIPDLLKKYQMLTNGLHILYLCETCDVACDSYDKAIEHCQKHYNNMESYDVIVNPCEICDLKFDSTCYDEHMALHDQDRNLEKGAFHVVKYVYSYLFQRDWNNLLSELPAAQAQQILASSIYRYGKSVKLRIVNEGPPVATLYKCGKCRTFVHPKSLTFHYRSTACDEATCKWKCRYCNRPMSTESTKINHESMHRTHSKFQIVYFNEEGDEEFNNNLREHETRKTFSNLSNNGFFNFYICEKCKCCLASANNKDHRCAKISDRVRCAKCQLYFSMFYIGKHRKLHDMYPNLCRKYIKLTSYKPKPFVLKSPRLLNPGIQQRPTITATEKDVDLYKCMCGLHFTTLKGTEKHLALCNARIGDTSTEKCSKCGLLFDTTQLVTHLCKHHSNGNEKNTNFKIEVIRKYCKVYVNGFVLLKCVKCNVHFTSTTSVHRHFKENHVMNNLATCPHCKLVFRPYSLFKHIEKHHKAVKPSKDNLKIKSGVAKPSLKLKPGIIGMKLHKNLQKSGHELKKRYGKMLFRCRECKHKTFFLSLKALNSHYTRKTHNRATEQCEECHYSFLQKGPSMGIHKYVHHKLMKLKRGDFLIKVPARKHLATAVTSEEASQNSSEVDEPEPIKTETLIVKPKHRSLARKSTTKSIVSKLNTTKMTVSNISDKASTIECVGNTPASKDVFTNGKQKYKFFNVLFKCEICNSHFLTGQHVMNHINDIHVKSILPTSVELCHCGLTFSKYILSRHQQMHHEKQDLTASDFYIVPVNRYNDIVGHKHLFRCGVCKINYMKLNRLEEHMNDVEHYLGKTRCPKCHLAFLPGTLTAHIALHHDVLDLSADDYAILQSVGDDDIVLVAGMELETTQDEQSFNDARQKRKIGDSIPRNVGVQPKSKDMYDQFIESSDFESIKNNIQQLAETSVTESATEYLKHLKGDQINFSEPSARGRINLMNLYKDKLYRCSVCDTNYLHSGHLEKHIRVKKACPEYSVVCLICDLKIAVKSLINHVKFQHKMLNLVRDDFVITDSNHKIDLSNVYDTCASGDESVLNSEKDDISILSQEDSISTVSKDDVNRSGALYRCKKCSCNFLCPVSLEHHGSVYCNYDLKTYQCHVCQLLFTKISLGKHMRRDHKGATSAKLHQSRSQSTFDESIAKISPSPSPSRGATPNRTKKYTQAVDNSKTPKEFLTRLKLTQEFYSEINIDFYNNELYKCNMCPLYFFSAFGLRKHLTCYKYREHVGCDVVTCKFCDKEFTSKVIAKHVYVHHVKLNIPKNGYQIMDSNGKRLVNGSGGKIVDKPMGGHSTESTYQVGQDDCSEISLHDDDDSDNAEEPKEIADKISTLNIDLYSNKLFKCNVCNLHFLTTESWHWHIKNAKHGAQKTYCTFCGLAFTVKTLPTHVFIHHDKLNLMNEHFLINCSLTDEIGDTDEERKEIVADATVTPRNNITDQINVLKSSGLKEFEMASTSTDNAEINNEHVIENIVSTHKSDTIEDHRENVESADTTFTNNKEVLSVSPREESSPKSDSSTPESKNTSETKEKIIKLYKCAECNVCFLNQTACYKHVVKHTPLDSKDYIECKLCGYQFMIIFLHKHIWKHHNRVFKSENVLIEEYHPNVLCHGTPKIEIYYGSDKVQSKLVSTTSEGNTSVEIDDHDVSMTGNVDVSDANALDNIAVVSSEDTGRADGIVIDLNIENMDIDLTNASITIDE